MEELLFFADPTRIRVRVRILIQELRNLKYTLQDMAYQRVLTTFSVLAARPPI